MMFFCFLLLGAKDGQEQGLADIDTVVHLADVCSAWIVVDLGADFVDAGQGVHNNHPLLGIGESLGRDDEGSLDLVVLLLK